MSIYDEIDRVALEMEQNQAPPAGLNAIQPPPQSFWDEIEKAAKEAESWGQPAPASGRQPSPGIAAEIDRIAQEAESLAPRTKQAVSEVPDTSPAAPSAPQPAPFQPFGPIKSDSDASMGLMERFAPGKPQPSPAPSEPGIASTDLLARAKTEDIGKVMHEIRVAEATSGIGGFLKQIPRTVNRALQQEKADRLRTQAFLTDTSKDEARRYEQLLADLEYREPSGVAKTGLGKSFLSALGSSTRMVRGLGEGAVMGGTLAVGSALLGAPELAPVAFKWGMTAGQLEYWMNQATADIDRGMESAGVDPRIAKPLTLAGAGIYTGIEFVNDNINWVPGLGPVASKFTGKIKSAYLRKLIDYGVQVVKESGEELGQTGTEEGFILLGRVLDDLVATKEIPRAVANIYKNSVQAFTQSVPSMMWLGGGNLAASAAIDLAQKTQQGKQAVQKAVIDSVQQNMPEAAETEEFNAAMARLARLNDLEQKSIDQGSLSTEEALEFGQLKNVTGPADTANVQRFMMANRLNQLDGARESGRVLTVNELIEMEELRKGAPLTKAEAAMNDNIVDGKIKLVEDGRADEVRAAAQEAEQPPAAAVQQDQEAPAPVARLRISVPIEALQAEKQGQTTYHVMPDGRVIAGVQHEGALPDTEFTLEPGERLADYVRAGIPDAEIAQLPVEQPIATTDAQSATEAPVVQPSVELATATPAVEAEQQVREQPTPTTLIAPRQVAGEQPPTTEVIFPPPQATSAGAVLSEPVKPITPLRKKGEASPAQLAARQKFAEASKARAEAKKVKMPVPVSQRAETVTPPPVAAEAVQKPVASQEAAGGEAKAPELMTPEEWKSILKESDALTAKEDGNPDNLSEAEYDRNRELNKLLGPKQSGKRILDSYDNHVKPLRLIFGPKALDGGIQHVFNINNATDAKLPVSAAAVDAYGIKLPEGYVREGDRYVFKPSAPPPSEATKAVTAKTEDIVDDSGKALIALSSVFDADKVKQMQNSIKDKDGVLIVNAAKGEASFVPSDTLLGTRSPEEVLKSIKLKRGQKFIIRNGQRESAQKATEYKARAHENGDWDSGNLSPWQLDILEQGVKEGKLTKRQGRGAQFDEMSANGIPTIYEPSAPAPQGLPKAVTGPTAEQAPAKTGGDIPANEVTAPLSVEDALNKGQKVKAPKGATFIRVTDQQGNKAVVRMSDADTLKDGGPYKKAEFGIAGTKGKGFMPMKSKGEVAEKKVAPVKAGQAAPTPQPQAEIAAPVAPLAVPAEKAMAEPASEKDVPAEVVSPTSEETQPDIESGEELKYNRRNRIERREWADFAQLNPTLKVREVQKNNIWPVPNYQAMIDSGNAGEIATTVDTARSIIAHIMKQTRDAVAAKPNISGVATDDKLKTYVEGVRRIEQAVNAWAQDAEAIKGLFQGQLAMAGAMAGRPTNIMALVGGSKGKTILDYAYPDGWKAHRDEMIYLGGNRLLRKLQPGMEEIRKAMKETEAGWPTKREAWQIQGYRTVASNPRLVTVDQPGGKDPIQILYIGEKHVTMFRKGQEAEADAALAAVKSVSLWKKSRFIDSFVTEEEAIDAAREATKREGSGQKDIQGTNVAQAERVGAARRLEGEDITAEKLRDTFGFKGVNFGNWMQGPSARSEAQAHLNAAYDAFLDLAEILNVPPKALSLNGMLGLAIGAQGSGRHAAHFVAGLNEINLTRTAGAGALAHEWAHGLDHYFGTLAGVQAKTEPFITEHVEMVGADGYIKRDGKKVLAFQEVRPEIAKAFHDIVNRMRLKPITQEALATMEKERLSRDAKAIDGWLRTIRRNDFSGQEAEFDVLAERVRNGDFGDGRIAVSSSTALSPVLDEMRQLYKGKNGRVPSLQNYSGLQRWLDSIIYHRSHADAITTHVPQTMSTEYLDEATELDAEKKGKRYWTTRLEMFARAFDAYVADRLAEKTAKNTYLAGLEIAPPKGAERKIINEAFNKLVNEIKTRETDKGVMMYGDLETGQPDTIDQTIRMRNGRRFLFTLRRGSDGSLRPTTSQSFYDKVIADRRKEIEDDTSRSTETPSLSSGISKGQPYYGELKGDYDGNAIIDAFRRNQRRGNEIRYTPEQRRKHERSQRSTLEEAQRQDNSGGAASVRPNLEFAATADFRAIEAVAQSHGIRAVAITPLPGGEGGFANGDIIAVVGQRDAIPYAIHEIGHVLAKNKDVAINQLIDSVDTTSLQFKETSDLLLPNPIRRERYSRNARTILKLSVEEAGMRSNIPKMNKAIDRLVAEEMVMALLSGNNDMMAAFPDADATAQQRVEVVSRILGGSANDTSPDIRFADLTSTEQRRQDRANQLRRIAGLPPLETAKPVAAEAKVETPPAEAEEPAPKMTRAQRSKALSQLREQVRAQKGRDEAEVRQNRKTLVINAARELLPLTQDQQSVLSLLRPAFASVGQPEQGMGLIVKAIDKLEELSEAMATKDAIRKFKKAVPSAKEIAEMRPVLRDKMNEVLGDVDLTNMSKKSKDSLRRMAAFLADPDNDFEGIPEEVLHNMQDRIGRLDKKAISDFSIEEIEAMTNMVKSYVHQQKLMDKLEAKQEKREDYRLGRDIEAEVLSHKPIAMVKLGETRQQSAVKRFARRVAELQDMLWNRGAATQRAIAGRIGPTAFKYFHYNAYRGMSKATGIVQSQWDYLKNALNKTSFAWGSKALQDLSEIASGKGKAKTYSVTLKDGRKMEATGAELITLLAHGDQPYIIKQLAKGVVQFMPASEPKSADPYHVTMEDLAKVRTQNPELYKVARILVDTMSQLQDALNEKSVELYGYEMFGEEDYFPVKTSSLYRRENAKSLMKGEEAMQAWVLATPANQSMMQERTGGSGVIILEDAFKAFTRHAHGSGALIGMQEHISKAQKILAQPEVKRAIVKTYGDAMLDEFKDRIKNWTMMSQPNEMAPETERKMATPILSNIVRAKLSANPSPILKQAGGLLPLLSQLAETPGEQWRLLTRYGTPNMAKPEWHERTYKYAPLLRERAEMHSGTLVAVQAAGSKAKPFLGREPVVDKLMRGMSWSDANNSVAAFASFWGKLKEQHPDWSNDQIGQKAGQLAEDAIGLTQNASNIMDATGIALQAKQSLALRLITTFKSQQMAIYNTLAEANRAFQKSPKSAQDFGNLLHTTTMSLVVNSLYSAAVTTLLSAGRYSLLRLLLGRPDPEEDKRESWLKRMVWMMISDAAATGTYGADDAIDAAHRLVRAIEAHRLYGLGTGRENLLSDAFSNFSDALAKLIKAKGTADYTEAFASAAMGAANMFGAPEYPLRLVKTAAQIAGEGASSGSPKKATPVKPAKPLKRINEND